MKKLFISLKTPAQALNDFEKALTVAHGGKRRKTPHYEISFDKKKDFDRFLKNISLLVSIRTLKPASIYELAKMINKDQSSLNKLILFFEEIGVVKIKKRVVKGRTVKTPQVEYGKIEFDLEAA